MKTCPKCGNKLGDDALFCNNCGYTMSNVAPDGAAAGGAQQSAPQPDNSAPQGGFQQQNSYQQNAYQQNGYQQPYAAFDPKDHTGEFEAQDIADNKLYALLPYFFGVLGIIPALMIENSPYTRFHVKNSIRLMVAMMLLIVPCIIPIVGWIAAGIGYIIVIVLWIMGIVHVFQGKARDLPIISNIKFLQ